MEKRIVGGKLRIQLVDFNSTRIFCYALILVNALNLPLSLLLFLSLSRFFSFSFYISLNSSYIQNPRRDWWYWKKSVGIPERTSAWKTDHRMIINTENVYGDQIAFNNTRTKWIDAGKIKYIERKIGKYFDYLENNLPMLTRSVRI